MTRRTLIIAKLRRIIEKRRRMIMYAAVTLFILSAAYAAWNAFSPLYKSTCTIKFEKETTIGGLFSKILSSYGSNDAETQKVIITSYDFLTEVAVNLSLIPGTGPVNEPEVYAVIDNLRSKITFEKQEALNIIHISVTDRDPDFAQKMANELAETYNRQQSLQQQKRLKEVIKYIEEQLKTTKDNLEKSEEQFNRFSQDNQLILIDHQSGDLLLRNRALEDEIRAEKDSNKIDELRLEIQDVNEKINDLMNKKLEFNRLKKEVDSFASMVSFLEEKKQEAMIGLAERQNVIEFVKRAQLPSIPVNPPNIVKACLTGLIAGIILGLIMALLSEIFTRQAGLIDEIENYTDLKVLGVIPRTDRKTVLEGMERIPGEKTDESSCKKYINLVSHFAPKTMISESIRALRTNVLCAGEGESVRTIAVTSSYPGEGKSMISVNLAISMAQAGLKTLLVGSDYRNPALGKIFSTGDSPGLTDVLLGNYNWEDTIKTVTDMIIGQITMDDLMHTPGIDNLNIITSGSIPVNPSEFINSQRFGEFMETVKQEYDIIIFDSGPALITADTAILGVKVDAILIVYQPGIASKNALKRTYNQLKQVKCNILGAILNGVKPDLIPDALRKKYSRNHSAHASSIKMKTGTDKKKNRLTGVLILSALLIILISALLWQMGIIFPKKYTLPKEDIKKSKETPVAAEPAEKEVLPEKKENTEKIEVEDAPEIKPEELPVSTVEEINKADEDRDSTPEEIKPEYQEGKYPYSIYMGSFKNIERAERAVDIYSEQKIDSYPVRMDLAEKGIWYRIYSGNYTDPESARAFIEENKIRDAEIKRTAYACYIDSFTNNEGLEAAESLLKEKKYYPYVIADHAANVHFLFAGAYTTRNGAEELSEELRADGVENKVVSR